MYHGLEAQHGKTHCPFFIIAKYLNVSEKHYFKFFLLATQAFLESCMSQKSSFGESGNVIIRSGSTATESMLLP